jgi:hypothetical protein
MSLSIERLVADLVLSVDQGVIIDWVSSGMIPAGLTGQVERVDPLIQGV